MTERRRILYGRRTGRRLRPGQRDIVETLLPACEIRLDAAPAGPLDPATLFGGAAPGEVWLEIGFGAGEHLAWQAERNPAVGFIGCEPYLNGVVRLLASVRDLPLANVRIFRDDARQLVDRLAPRSLHRAFILFPDPWPKLRHHKRRMVSADVLRALAAAMVDDAELRIATDDPGYLEWILRHVGAEPAFEWTARRAGDWRERPADWPETRYEAKARAAGRRCAFLRYRRRPRGAAGGRSGSA